MQKFQSELLQELQWRGFISQITHEKELDETLTNCDISAYIGFDCTAKSLHVGSLIQIMIARLLQKHGHKPIILLGGGTTKIGDPSGKDEARKFLDDEQISENLAGIRKVLAKFIDFGDSKIGIESFLAGGDAALGASLAGEDSLKASDVFDRFEDGDATAFLAGGDAVAGARMMGEEVASAGKISGNSDFSEALFVNNDDWLKNLNYIEFLRDVGRHFSVNRMLGFDSVKLRLDRDQPLSFLEFNYMILQAYDFYVLNKEYGCKLQIGGSDQWGNIVNGVELTRRMSAVENSGVEAEKKEVFGLTSPLLTTSDGKKMGKTANGAVWLDSEMLNPFEYFQYFRNVADDDAVRFLKLFTDLERAEIAEFEKLEGQEINKAKEVLAFEATKICHGKAAALASLEKAKQIFVAKNVDAFEEKALQIEGEVKKLPEIMKEIGACKSNGEARRLIQGGGVKVDGEVVADSELLLEKNAEFDLQVGKKRFYRVKLG